MKYEKLVTANKELVLKGKARINNDERRNPKPLIYEDAEHKFGMRFQFRIKAMNKDGELNNTDSSLIITNATEVILYVTAATSFNGFDKFPDKDGKDENALANTYMQAVTRKPFTTLLKEHIKDYQQYFNRLSIAIDKKIMKLHQLINV